MGFPFVAGDVGAAAIALRLVLSGSQPLLQGLAAALSRDERFEVIARLEGATAAREPLEPLERNRAADVLVLGVEGLDGDLCRLIGKVATLFPATAILVLGRAASDEQVVDCLQAGAGGFLSHDQPLAEVTAAIEAVARGERVCPPRVMRLLFARLSQLGRERKRRDRLAVLALTARELEILRLVAEGLSNRQIARRLYLSSYTVKNHVHRILDALGVQSRWQAVSHAYDKGWLQDPRSPRAPAGSSRLGPSTAD